MTGSTELSDLLSRTLFPQPALAALSPGLCTGLTWSEPASESHSLTRARSGQQGLFSSSRDPKPPFPTSRDLFQESIAPLFEIRMELDEEGLTFNPSLEMGGEDGFLMLIEGLINDLYNVARLIPRLAKGRINYKVSLGLLPHFCISLLGRVPAGYGLAQQSLMSTDQKVIGGVTSCRAARPVSAAGKQRVMNFAT